MKAEIIFVQGWLILYFSMYFLAKEKKKNFFFFHSHRIFIELKIKKTTKAIISKMIRAPFIYRFMYDDCHIKYF